MTSASQEKGRRGKVRPQTIKKEVDTLRVIWNWAVTLGHVTGAVPIKGIKLGKATEQLPFRTWDEIERTIGRGGLSAVEHSPIMGLPILDQFANRRSSGNRQAESTSSLPLSDVRFRRAYRSTAKRR